MSDSTQDTFIGTTEEIEYQDIALAFLTEGMDSVRDIYLDFGIPPHLSIEVWNLLHAQGLASEELASWLVWVHSPTQVVGLA